MPSSAQVALLGHLPWTVVLTGLCASPVVVPIYMLTFKTVDITGIMGITTPCVGITTLIVGQLEITVSNIACGTPRV